MDSDVIEALRGSVRKWQGIVAGTEVDRGIDNCPLCRMFIIGISDDAEDCRGCPVSERTGQRYCNGSPYPDWDAYSGDEGVVVDEYHRHLAQRELDFLTGLLRDAEAA